MDHKVIAVLFGILISCFILDGVECSNFRGEEQPKHSAITTTKTIYGDTYNCIDIYKQPAFNHPALSNHKIRMSFWKEMEEKRKLMPWNRTTTKFNPKDLWLEGRGCPQGTVPIRRMTNEQQKRALHADQAVRNQSLASGDILDFAGIIVNGAADKKYGAAQAVINIYNPEVVGPGHYSSATIGVESGQNQIQVGWIVHPQLYGDYRTRLYTSWTADNHVSTGCFNQNCPGFVLFSSDVPLDFAFPNISQSEGQQYDSLIGLALTTTTGEWFLVYEFNTVIGYWPKPTLPNLASGADTIRWGGQVFTPSSDDTSSQMGSGQFRNGQRQITCYMRQVTYDETISPDKSSLQTQDSRCYYEGYNFYDNDPYWAYSFLFGGKGGKDGVTCIY